MCVFHSIRFKVNKGWATAVALFFVFMRKTPPFIHLFFAKYTKVFSHYSQGQKFLNENLNFT